MMQSVRVRATLKPLRYMVRWDVGILEISRFTRYAKIMDLLPHIISEELN